MSDEEAKTIIHAALVRLGIIRAGEYPSTDYFDYAKRELDALVANLHVRLAEQLCAQDTYRAITTRYEPLPDGLKAASETAWQEGLRHG